VRAHQGPATERYLRNVLAFAPPGAILVVSGDDTVGGFLYMKCALGMRPDVDVVTPRLLLTDWYWPRVSARLGFTIEHGVRRDPSADPSMNGSVLLAQLVQSGRPVLLDTWFAPKLETRFPSYPIGPLVRVVPAWDEVPSPDALYAMNDELFREMVIDDPPPPAATWAGARFASYTRPWRVVAGALERAGDRTKADAARARADALQPR